ncbi:protocadherin-9-like [Haliotis asinina]|uniref:protocadherin-9-like n=1 Tax=Haliotis asinina TaxID=109174 RepID=UPI00353249AF
MDGSVLVTEDTPLNYESLVASEFTYILIVKAEDTPSDEAAKSNVAVVVVKVLPENEFTPEFTLPVETSMTVPETWKPPYLVATFNAVDEDAGVDGDVSYEILSATDYTGTSALDKFVINPVSGELRLNDFLDADMATGGTDTYNIVVKATDGGTSPKSSNRDFIITVGNENDNAPVFLNFPTSIEVAENTDVGHALVTLITEDNDGDDVVANIEDLDETHFIISGNDVILERPLDYETSQCHTIVVAISDGTYKSNRTLVIKVTDEIDETPSIVTLTPVNVTEELPVDTVVGGLFLFTDRDRDDSHTFVLTGGDSHFFNMDAESGQVSIAERMDVESMSGRNVLDQLTLTVTDSAGLQAIADLTVEVVDINDATPVFAESVYNVDVSEGSSQEVLLDLVATDADSGTNGEISMQITAGDDPLSSRFELIGTQLSSLGNLDYESLADTQHMFLLTVEATDSPEKESPKTGVTVVAVTVLPENEFTPEFTLPVETSMTVPETWKPPYLVATFNAVDEDAGVDGDVSYEILSATDYTGTSALDKFVINPVSGELRLNDFLDADMATGGTDTYNIVVKATDGGTSPKSSNRDFIITVGNENDNAPVFLNFPTSIEVAENADVGHALVTLITEDNDGDDVVANIEDLDETHFIISGNDVILERPLDYETSQCHTIVVGW